MQTDRHLVRNKMADNKMTLLLINRSFFLNHYYHHNEDN